MAACRSVPEDQIAGMYELDRTLGKGHFAVVKLARHIVTGLLVAIKVIDKTKLDAMATGHLLQEVRCMKLVQHPNVVRLYEVIDTPSRLYLIMELGDGGDLYDYILRHEGGVAEDMARVLFAQIVRAVAYCHRLHVVHRDLKPENVVLFSQQGVKITDFGFSNLFQPGAMLSTSCGSLAYSAPEILLGEAYDAPAVDIWSLGVILYMLVCGRPPFQEANDSETLIRIMDCRYAIPTHVSPHCQDLISRMLQRAPSLRAALQEIEGHPWLQGVHYACHGSSTPLSSHLSLTPEEHQSILHVMVSRHIADQDTIQQALEADLYNHITATYYLLGERILGDKQDRPPELLQTPLLSSLGLQDKGFHHRAFRGTLPAGPAHRGASESGNLLSTRPLLQPGRPENPLSEYIPLPCQVLSLHTSTPDPPDPPLKSLGALQLIFEEEEEEEEEKEEAQLLRQALHSSTEQTVQAGMMTPSDPVASGGSQSPARPAPGQEERAEQLGALEGSPKGKVVTVVARNEQGELEDHKDQKEECMMEREDSQNWEEVGGRKDDLHKPAVQEQERVQSDIVSMCDSFMSDSSKVRSGNHVTADQPISGVHNQVCTVLDPPQPSPHVGGLVQCCRGKRNMVTWDPSSSVLENNNNPADKLSQRCFLPRKHCVDLRPDGLEARRIEVPSIEGEEGGNPKEGLHLSRSHNAPLDTCMAKEVGCEAALRVEPGKGKKLRERLLKLPLCEKALSFNIQPPSKEKLLPFAQYNCCHVL